MGAFNRIFRPKPGDFAENLVVGAIQIGTGGRALTATATVSVVVPKPFRKCQLISVAVEQTTAAAGGGAITAQVIKRAAGADVTQTGTFDLIAGATTLDKTQAIPITATDITSVFQAADGCRVDLVAATTVTTAPQAMLVCTWAVMN